MTLISFRHVRRALAVACVSLGLATAAATAQQPAAPASPPPAAMVPPSGQQAYASPQAAVDALIDAVTRQDPALLTKVFGTNYKVLVPSDADADDVAEARKKFLEGYAAAKKINMDGASKAILEVGNNGWTFPVPLVKAADGWRFDIVAGIDEQQDRVIGRNELAVIQIVLAIVDAQQDYAQMDPMMTGTGQYARRLLSSPGKKDGLYWPSKEGEAASPLGDLVAEAQASGANRQEGYYGYHYRLLYAQGSHAPGGAQDYVIHGRMVGGFAVIAWPVKYGETGVVTFVVSQDGVVYEKDLGVSTATAAAAIQTFDPDDSWKKSDTTP